MNICQCGCNEEIELYNCRGQIKRFKKGHNVVNFVKHLSEHPSWKGGKTFDSSGYYIIKKPDHPKADNRGYISEHRYIYEQYHKCCLLDWIIVHHKNEIITDNRIENLQAMTRAEHNRLHGKIILCNKYRKNQLINIK